VALDAMARLIRWKLPLQGVPTAGKVTLTSNGGSTNRYPARAKVTVNRVLGHRDTGETACPGDALYAQLPELRRRVGDLGPIAAGATRLTAVLDTGHTTYGERVPLRGLLMGAGGPLGAQPIQIQSLRKGRWVTARRVHTASDGQLVARIKPKNNGRLRLHFPGGPGERASASKGSVLRVKSKLALSKPPKRGARGAKLPVRGAVGPSTGLVYLALQVKRGSSWRKVGTKAVKVLKGRFATTLRPPVRGSYRWYVSTKASRLNDRGRSALVLLRIR
jgi:hypothetical protein